VGWGSDWVYPYPGAGPVGGWVGGWVQKVVLGVLWQGLGLALPGGSACSVMVAGMDREAQRPPLLSLSLQPCPPRRHCPAPSAAADPRAAHLDFHWHGRLQASPAHRGPAARTGKRQSQTAGCLLAACYRLGAGPLRATCGRFVLPPLFLNACRWAATGSLLSIFPAARSSRRLWSVTLWRGQRSRKRLDSNGARCAAAAGP
jgi:hypothetical protein